MRIENYNRIVVFDTVLHENFYPLSLTRPTFDLLCGAGSQLWNIETLLGTAATDLLVPKYLEQISKERYPNKKVNEEITERCLAINALLRPDYPLASEISKAIDKAKHDFILVDRDGVAIFGVLERIRPNSFSLRKTKEGIKITTLSEDSAALFKFPWEIVSTNGEIIRRQSAFFKSTNDIQDAKANFELIGRDLHASDSAAVERYVTFDTRNGPVILDDRVIVQSFSRLSGPAYIGKDSIIKSAKIRQGTTIGRRCMVGGEVEESILSDYTNKNHEGFIGHSILGSWINIGAMTTNSDLKNTYGPIRMNVGKSNPVNTKSIKVGCFIGDMSKTSIGTMIGSGRTVGVSSHIIGTAFEDVPSFTIHANCSPRKNVEMYLESAVETQRRMMERRNVKMSENYKSLIKSVFRMTSKDRRAGDVRKKKFHL